MLLNWHSKPREEKTRRKKENEDKDEDKDESNKYKINTDMLITQTI